jgi:hypothetical protein
MFPSRQVKRPGEPITDKAIDAGTSAPPAAAHYWWQPRPIRPAKQRPAGGARSAAARLRQLK